MTATTIPTRTTKTTCVSAGLVLIAGCSSASNRAGSSATTLPVSSTASTPASSAASKPDALDISGFSYDPSPLTVQAGATVTMTNQDSADHTLDSDVASLFTSGDVTRGRAGQVRHTEEGGALHLSLRLPLQDARDLGC